jgi:ParB-like chromosome segregation protein Spo0J
MIRGMARRNSKPTVEMPDAVPVDLADLKPHPRNYRDHPEDQIQHLIHSIETHGMYRNIVAAKDLTILAGHGVVEAANRVDSVTTIPTVVLDIESDSAAALKILAADNMLGHFAEDDDRILTDLLREIRGKREDLKSLIFEA